MLNFHRKHRLMALELYLYQTFSKQITDLKFKSCSTYQIDQTLKNQNQLHMATHYTLHHFFVFLYRVLETNMYNERSEL